MELPFPESGGGASLWKGGIPAKILGILFEMFIGHPSGGVQWAVGLTHLELSEDVRAEDLNSGVIHR